MLGLLHRTVDLENATADGSMRIAHLTHDTIVEFVGTSREIVSSQMNRLRRLGLIRYSRKYLDVYAQALLDKLKREEMSLPRSTELLTQSASLQTSNRRPYRRSTVSRHTFRYCAMPSEARWKPEASVKRAIIRTRKRC
jgi:hypothetical protein